MSIWSQIGDEIITQIPPDGQTAVDVYVDFSFSGEPIPEGIIVKFIAGKGKLDFGNTDPEQQVIKKWTEDEIIRSIVPMDGVILLNSESKTTRTLIRNAKGKLESRIVAKATLKPIGTVLKDEVTVAGYVSYDATGIISRLQPDFVKMPVASAGGVFLSTTEKYDPVANLWEIASSMPTGRSGLIVEEVSNKLYAIGGFAGNFFGNNESYDPVIDSWSTKTPMPNARAFSMSVTYGGEIYVMGGMNFGPGSCSSSVHKYNPITDIWTELADMPLPVAFGVAKETSGNIYVLFGASRMNGSGKSETENIDRFNLAVFKYDISLDLWTIEDVQLLSPTTTTLTITSEMGDSSIQVQNIASLPPYGVVIINDGGGNKEVHTYLSYDSKTGAITLDAPLLFSHSSSETVEIASLPEIRMGSNATLDGAQINVFNGQQFFSYAGNSGGTIRGTECSYDTVTKTYSCGTSSPSLPRYKAGHAIVGTTSYIVGGGSRKSQWANEVETLEAGIFSGPSGFSEMLFPRHSLGVAAVLGNVYAIGGSGDGHEPGWLKMDVQASPKDVRADGRSTSSIRIEATDASGDAPPDGTKLSVRGLIYVTATKQEQEVFKKSLQDSVSNAVQTSIGGTGRSIPPPRISILPVLFSAKDLVMNGGVASVILLPRSEDPIKEVQNLSSFVKANEAVVDQTKLKEQLGLPESEDDKLQVANKRRDLYNAAIEVFVDDPFFFGTTDTDSLIASKTQEKELATTIGANTKEIDFTAKPLASDGFSFNPPPAQQGLSANVVFFSDIVSIPDVQLITTDPVGASEAKNIIDTFGEEVPFGASPFLDAIIKAANPRTDDAVTYSMSVPTSIFIAASDNEDSQSAHVSQDVVDEVNGIAGAGKSPVFVTSFVVTDPVSLSARRARTDVADLEKISFDTGGNSFSVVNESYIDFVIERIKTSAPASIGSGTIIAEHEIEGYLSSIILVISNLIAGNSATIEVSYSTDGYNFTNLGVKIQPNVTYSIEPPIKTRFVRYVVTLRSKTFDSPKLDSVTVNYVRPNAQYLFTFPHEVSGQVSELASVVNHRLPDGGFSEAGFAHGESFMFDRDYGNIVQPTTKERGSILSINRSFDTIVGQKSTRDVLKTDDFLLYTSISGPWPQESETRVYVNDIQSNAEAYILAPEDGAVVFKKKLGPDDVIFIEVALPSTFRFGVKIVNPVSDSTGLLDSFAYMWGTTQDDQGYRLNRAPRAVNLFITPSPALPGGPLEANYTFVDPDGDEEDLTKTVITWFRNGVPISELTGKNKVINSDLIARRADGVNAIGIAKDQEWFFTIRPSDGKAFGPTATSAKVVVANVPPSTTEVKLKSSNEDDPSKFTSQDTIKAIADFRDIDGDVPSGNIFTWFVNGVEKQSGASDSLDPISSDAKDRIFSAGDAIRCEVIPSDGSDFGSSVSSDTVTVLGSPPTVEDATILPKDPSSLSNLRLTYSFVDADNRTDSSIIQWFRNRQRISELDGTRQVSSTLTAPGQEWQAEITPSNGLADGTKVKSNVVVIEF